MGCFLACFGASKSGKRRNYQLNTVLPRDQKSVIYKPVQLPIVPHIHEKTELHISHISEIRADLVERTTSGNRKKVTFNSNIVYEPVLPEEDTDHEPEIVESARKRNEEALTKSTILNTKSEDDLKNSSLGSYPLNHRYQNCRDSDDEVEEYSDIEDEDLDEDDEDDEYNNDYIEEDEHLCDSISSVESRTGISEHRLIEEDFEGIVGSNKCVRNRSGYVHSVLNPVENLTQWKAVKSKKTLIGLTLNHQKENHSLDYQEPPRISFSSNPSFKPRSGSPKLESQEIAVDTSLSNWLVSPKNLKTFSPEKGSNSPRRLEDRSILGALSVEEIKKFSATTSPRKSPSRSPEDMPIVGSVGSYWSPESDQDSGSVSSYKGIPNTTSKYREDKRVNWHSTPFETRLERALNRDDDAKA